MNEEDNKFKIDTQYIEEKYNYINTLKKAIDNNLIVTEFTYEHVELNNLLTKIFVLSIGSYFEKETLRILAAIYKHHIYSEALYYHIHKEILSDKFFKLFDFTEKNINKFFSFYGKDFKKSMQEYRNQDPSFMTSEANFLQLINSRNIFAHEDIITVSTPTTIEDYYKYALNAAKMLNETFENLLTYP